MPPKLLDRVRSQSEAARQKLDSQKTVLSDALLQLRTAKETLAKTEKDVMRERSLNKIEKVAMEHKRDPDVVLEAVRILTATLVAQSRQFAQLEDSYKDAIGKVEELSKKVEHFQSSTINELSEMNEKNNKTRKAAASSSLNDEFNNQHGTHIPVVLKNMYAQAPMVVESIYDRKRTRTNTKN